MLQDLASPPPDAPSFVVHVDHRRVIEAALARHRPALAERARRLCRGRLDADDLVQDTLERALRAADQIREPRAVRSWLFTILTHVFIDRVRSLRAAPQAEVFSDVMADDEPIEAEPWTKLSLEDLQRALAHLPADARVVFIAHCVHGKPYQTIATELGIPRGTVGTRLLRARRVLRRVLTQVLAEREQAQATQPA